MDSISPVEVKGLGCVCSRKPRAAQLETFAQFYVHCRQKEKPDQFLLVHQECWNSPPKSFSYCFCSHGSGVICNQWHAGLGWVGHTLVRTIKKVRPVPRVLLRGREMYMCSACALKVQWAHSHRSAFSGWRGPSFVLKEKHQRPSHTDGAILTAPPLKYILLILTE